MPDAHSDGIAEITRRVTDAYWDRYPGRILACYVTGSWSGGYAVVGSDLDLVFVLGDRVTEQDQAESAYLAADLGRTAHLGLDLDLVGIADEVRPALKLDSTLVRGPDVRDQLHIMPLEDWIIERRYAGCWLICHLFGRAGVAQIPLPFPNTSGEFYGYNTNRDGASDGPEGSTKDLVRSTSWAMTALLASESQRYITSKAQLLHDLVRCLPGEWASHARDLLDFCRNQTNYAIPTNRGERATLRRLCERTREFEDYYLSHHRRFLLDELHSGDARSRAREKLTETPFGDADVQAALR